MTNIIKDNNNEIKDLIEPILNRLLLKTISFEKGFAVKDNFIVEQKIETDIGNEYYAEIIITRTK